MQLEKRRQNLMNREMQKAKERVVTKTVEMAKERWEREMMTLKARVKERN